MHGQQNIKKKYELLLVALRLQHEMHMRHIAACSLSGYTAFFQITS